MKKLIFIFILLSNVCRGMNYSYTVNSINQQGVTILKRDVDINAPFQINSSDVVLDMNGKTIRGGILINSGLSNVTIRNGIVDPTTTTTLAAIYAKAGCQNIQLIDLKIKNAQQGIFFQTVSDSLIERCEVTATSSAVVLSVCNNIMMDSVLVQNNVNMGFSLLTSTSCFLRDCKALNTGLGNTLAANNTVIGFASSNGSCNIFERCIANATQAFSTTDFGSLIAGFALQGTENRSKIIECEASNTAVSSGGVTVPYGILLQKTLDTSLLETTTAFVGTNVHFYTVSWSPDSALFAGGQAQTGINNTQLFIFAFNRPMATTMQLASLGGFSDIFSVDWSPMNDYIALADGGLKNVYIIHFERMNNTLTLVTSANVAPSNPVELEWRFDGRYIAVADAGNNALRIYKFDSTAQSLSQVATASVSGTLSSVTWSPDGNFVATASVPASGSGNNVSVFAFNAGTNTLTLRATNTIPASPVGVSWSPDGVFLAVVDNVNNQLYIYRFNTNTNGFNVMASTPKVSHSLVFDPLSVTWSPDSAYVAIPQNPNGVYTSSNILIFYFDRGNNTLTYMIEAIYALPDGPQQADWSPDGQNILLADTQEPNIGIFVYEAWTYPSENVVINNTVYGNSGGIYSQGVGISGSSIANTVIQNTAYANSLLVTTTNSQLVATNYQFVPNVFNQLFGAGPTALQNIALAYDQPVVMPDDLALILKQAQYQIINLDSQLDVINIQVGMFQNSFEVVQTCTAVAIFAANTPTTISTGGVYCISSSPVTGLITISANDVVLDLNNYTITGGINVVSNSNRITVKDGTISRAGNNAITVNSGCSEVTIRNVVAKNSVIGMQFNSVTHGLIEGCTLTQNTTGVQLSSSRGIAIQETNAEKNLNAGFELLQSATCCLSDCQALGTGVGNTTVRNNNVFGFISTAGFSNIFERCIANSTQALSTTDFNSVVAGFMLTGTEHGSKIIECESSNATTSLSGVTVPYGILLQEQVSNLFTVTSINPGGAISGNDTILTLAWSPDGKYLATGGSINPGSSSAYYTLIVYQFDYVQKILTQIIATNVFGNGTGDAVHSVAWSPDGNYLAVGGVLNPFRVANDFIIYRFDSSNQTITQVQGFQITTASTGFTDISWSPDERYLVVGGGTSLINNDDIQLYQFNIITQTATFLQGISIGSSPYNVASIAWSPDGNYVAVGGDLASGGNDLQLYSFSRSTQTLSLVDTENTTANVSALAWSPNGKYLAVGGNLNFNDFKMYQLNRSTQKLQLITSINFSPYAETVYSIAWSSDSQYVAITGNIYSGGDLIIYKFDPGIPSLTKVVSTQEVVFPSKAFIVCSWSPDGQYIATGGDMYGGIVELNLNICQALTFPSNNVIKGNTVYCNSGAKFPSGFGISGSSIANMIIQNTAYSNPIYPQGSSLTHVVVPSNYAFACNVLDSQFGLNLSLMQNAAVDSFQPFPMAENAALLIRQDIAEVATLGACVGTAITQILGGTLTLSVAGNYCLGANLTGDILITNTSVALNLNGHCLTGKVTVQTAQNVVVQNGTIEAFSNGGVSPTGAINIANSVVYAIVRDILINTRNATVDPNSGRPGIVTSGSNVTIKNCIINTGNGFAATSAANGGDGISVGASSVRTIIRDCIITAGSGATGTTPGNGGNGIHVMNGASGVEVFNCLVKQTGSGGNNTVSSAGGGNGGNAVQIDTSAIDTAVTNCILRNTGSAGTGTSTSTGVAGRAVNDLVTITPNLSQVFSNFAHNIANATKFDIQATNIESGIKTPNPPTATPVNPFANVFT